MKRLMIAALAAASVLTGGAAMAAPLHLVGGGHGPVMHGGPGGFHPGHGGFHPGPGGFHPHPIGFPHPGPHWGGFHHWGYGSFLPRGWLVPANFIVDYVTYDLAPPPADFEWVQDGPDALLVNLDSGQVVQVVPNAFA